jgi:hypothetical protein
MAQYKNIAVIMPVLFWRVLDDENFEIILDIMANINFFAAPS